MSKERKRAEEIKLQFVEYVISTYCSNTFLAKGDRANIEQDFLADLNKFLDMFTERLEAWPD